MEMEDLPDELLLAVMRYLRAQDLLTCRLVCKRVGSLALDPSVWRHQALCCSSTWACAVLRLAPCVGSLDLTWWTSTSKVCLRSHTTRTRCAAANLCVTCRSSGDEEQAVLMIRHQETLGRLKCITVRLKHKMNAAAASSLLESLASTSGLEELSIFGETGCIPTTARPVLRSHGNKSVSSLRLFSLRWDRMYGNSNREDCVGKVMEDFYRFLLAEHAATLEKIHLDTYGISTSPPASVLASMPNLRELRCSTFPGMKPIAACKSLKELYLIVTPHMDEPDTAEFLSRAYHLREITLGFLQEDSTWPRRSSSTTGAGLVWSLASSGQSCVESLSITNLPGGDLPQLQQLLRALPMLSSLRRLQVEVAPDELLLGITRLTAPALLNLVVNQSNWRCIHAWLHRREVRTLLSKNPWLHVEISIFHSKCDERPCDVCKEECHDELWDSNACFFTHDPKAICPCPEVHKSGPWHHISKIATLEILTTTYPEAWADLAFKPNEVYDTDSSEVSDSDLDDF